MSKFNKLVEELLSEMAANVAGGELSVTGPVTSGNYGNQFPSQNSKAYNDGNNLPVAPADLILGKKSAKNRKNKKRIKAPYQRRKFSAL
jgi:hypothetical protein